MKKFFMMAFCAIAATSAFAQTTVETVEIGDKDYNAASSTISYNWFVSAGAGVQTYFGDHNKQLKSSARISPAFDVAVGKWLTPGIGLRIAFSGLQAKGAAQPGQNYATGKPADLKSNYDSGAENLQEQKFNYFNLHFDALFNLSNLCFGYKANRFYNAVPYIGIGWARNLETPLVNAESANVGLYNTFRISPALNAFADARIAFINDRFDGLEGGRYAEGPLSFTVGLVYNIAPRGWKKNVLVRYDNEALNELRAQLNAANAENARLKNNANNAGGDTKTVYKTVAAGYLILFGLNQTTLTHEARTNLSMLARIIKSSDASTVYNVTGYADMGTGNPEINHELSKKRAEAVYNCLVKEFGVNASQLNVNYKGGVDNMYYDDPNLSRSVIISRAE